MFALGSSLVVMVYNLLKLLLNFSVNMATILTLLHSEQRKLHGVLAVLSAIGLRLRSTPTVSLPFIQREITYETSCLLPAQRNPSKRDSL